MKILLLGNIESSHLKKWIMSLSDCGTDLHVFTIGRKRETGFGENVKIYYSGFAGMISRTMEEGSLFKLIFLFSLPSIRKIYRRIKPDIIHAHYATSYGLLGVLLKAHPLIISYWGSDIFSFPRKGKFNKLLTEFILRRADIVLSSSRTMAAEISNYTKKEVRVIHFGVNPGYFRKNRSDSEPGNEIVIGTIKMLEDIYGIDILIRIFKKLKDGNPSKKLRLLLVGGGSREKELKKIVSGLELNNSVTFTGQVPYNEVLEYHNKIDIFANLSRHESFGVSVLEASSCEVPVVASDRGGLPEVVADGVSGYTVSLEDESSIIEKFNKLVNDPALRSRMGKAGRDFVIRHYDWNNCVNEMIEVYKKSGVQNNLI